MANPNIVSTTSIYGISTSSGISTTAHIGILTNGASSNKVLKINTIRSANVDGVAAADISIGFNAVGTAVTHYLARTIVVPPDSALVVVDKLTSFYLPENYRIVVQASASNDIDIFISYEEIG